MSLDRLRLIRAEGVGPVTYRRLMQRYGDAARALDALPGLARAGGRAAPPIIPRPADIVRELDAMAQLGGRFLFVDDAGYPPWLALLDDAPPALSVVGPADLSARSVALVGSRNASSNGRAMAENLAAELAGGGTNVVSGLARGIDSAAHKGALSTGVTIACVAGGLDVVYPPENASLQARIAETGAVVSEMPLGTTPLARHFPRRNRVIAGLSLGVVVIEAAPRSGSLITARLAQEYHRELFAVPGSPMDPRCRGSNDLLRQGAHLTETAADVLANLPDHPLREGIARDPMFARDTMSDGLREPEIAWDEVAVMPVAEQESTRQALLTLLGPAPASVDVLIRHCQLSAAAVASALLDLEIAGRLERLPGNRVALLAQPG